MSKPITTTSGGVTMHYLNGKWHREDGPRDGKQNNLEDISVLDIPEIPSYGDPEKCRKEYFEKMEDHLIAVYNL